MRQRMQRKQMMQGRQRKILCFLCFPCFFCLPAPAQGTLSVQMEYEVQSPWRTPCSATVTTNCVKGWRITNTTEGQRTELFDIAAAASGFTGTLTVSGSGPVPTATGTVVAQTVAVNHLGAELLSVDSNTATFGSAPGPPSNLTTQLTARLEELRRDLEEVELALEMLEANPEHERTALAVIQAMQ